MLDGKINDLFSGLSFLSCGNHNMWRCVVDAVGKVSSNNPQINNLFFTSEVSHFATYVMKHNCGLTFCEFYLLTVSIMFIPFKGVRDKDKLFDVR